MQTFKELLLFFEKNYELPLAIFLTILGSVAVHWLVNVVPGAIGRLWQLKTQKPTINIKYYRAFFNSPYKNTEDYEQHCARKKSRFW